MVGSPTADQLKDYERDPVAALLAYHFSSGLTRTVLPSTDGYAAVQGDGWTDDTVPDAYREA